MTARTDRIVAEVVRYGREAAPYDPARQVLVASVYSFGIEVGLAIAAAAAEGEDARVIGAVLKELREAVYHGQPDAWVNAEMDTVATAIAHGEAGS
jgi:hypothetical protein